MKNISPYSPTTKGEKMIFSREKYDVYIRHINADINEWSHIVLKYKQLPLVVYMLPGEFLDATLENHSNRILDVDYKFCAIDWYFVGAFSRIKQLQDRHPLSIKDEELNLVCLSFIKI